MFEMEVTIIDQRKQLVIEEILFWKEHKLLPPEYCDFLLALYSKGDGFQQKLTYKQKVVMFIQLFLLSVLIPFSFLIIYCTQFQIILQLTILILFLGYSVWMYYTLKHRRRQYKSYYHWPLMTSFLLALFISVHLSKYYLHESFSFWIISIHFVCWVLYGLYKHVHYLVIIGITSLLFLLIYTVL
jgi:hypothetical protein